ncbi:hypothetical protein DFJ58DRAFT_731606 [Suillus subalutaceus]|uniref:uncharacterized protein n=1 Tax=Suillus subalutaceus TaxID=48586 RepID=UPI001B87AF45|nr:uncharacterized protein DFJ58DRAFT_731606 [Suillus subalutaceus]KAG1843481.1 hypothetical protein DFJ58DRAFT_731606 [Suillus subalutaceus]
MDAPGIVDGALSIYKTLPQAVAKRKVLEDQLDVGDHNEDRNETTYLNLQGKKDEDVWSEDFAYLEILAKDSEA